MVELGTHVRSLNSMYRDYGVGKVYKVRDGLCKVEFNPSVFSLPPFRSENFILSLDEVELCPTPLERAKAGHWEEAWKFDLRQMAARFLTTNKGGQLSNARTEILPHQIFTAYTVVSSPRRRFMLADEVGLGKTIEAGMVWQALFQRGYANRTLIITPAGLTRQWQEEFKDKFQADDFEIFGRDFTATNPRIWDLRARAIASLDRLKRKEHKRILLENTVVVLPDGSIDAELSSLAASRYSENESPSPQAERALGWLDKMDVEEAFQYARGHIERTVQLWDWDEDIELIGVARVVALPAD